MRKHARRWIVSAAVSLPASAIGLTAGAQQPHVTQEAPKVTAATPRASSTPILVAPKNPYGKLFQPRASELRQLQTPQSPEPAPVPSLPPGSHEPQIDCKIRKIVVDPSIDRGIRLPNPPTESAFAMRILEHPCLKP
jgi:hypothetical protein